MGTATPGRRPRVQAWLPDEATDARIRNAWHTVGRDLGYDSLGDLLWRSALAVVEEWEHDQDHGRPFTQPPARNRPRVGRPPNSGRAGDTRHATFCLASRATASSTGQDHYAGLHRRLRAAVARSLTTLTLQSAGTDELLADAQRQGPTPTQEPNRRGHRTGSPADCEGTGSSPAARSPPGA